MAANGPVVVDGGTESHRRAAVLRTSVVTSGIAVHQSSSSDVIFYRVEQKRKGKGFLRFGRSGEFGDNLPRERGPKMRRERERRHNSNFKVDCLGGGG